MEKKGSRGPTMMDVALHAGVAVSTVSHVLNNTASVSGETKQKVMQAVTELNYTPNAMARGLRQAYTNLIGVVVPDIANQFYAECASGVLQATDIAQTVLVCNSVYDKRRERAHVQTLLERRVDGLIFFGGLEDSVLHMARESQVPVVLGDREKKGFCSVVFDNETPLRQLVGLLAQNGIRRIGYISEPVNMQNVRRRSEVVADAAGQYGVHLDKRWTVIDARLQLEKVKNTVSLMGELLDSVEGDLPEIFITSNDMIALGVINALQARGLRVPEDVGVTGIDDIELAKHTTPALTTINQTPQVLGKTCFSLLRDIIYGKQGGRGCQTTSLSCELIIRRSIQLGGVGGGT